MADSRPWMPPGGDGAPDEHRPPDDERRQVIAARVERLYQSIGPTTAGGILAAVVLWATAYLHGHHAAAIAWAAMVHASQLLRLGVAIAYVRSRARATTASWLRRQQATLLLSSLVWSLAGPLLLHGNDAIYAATLLLVLLSVAVTGLSAISVDKLSVLLWLAPLSAAIPATLLWGNLDSQEYRALGVLSMVFLVVHLRMALMQHATLDRAIRTQLDNAALVERLNHQVALTEQASIDKSRFLAAASHDLRQPLHALSFFGSTLERKLSGSPEHTIIFNMMRSIEALDRSFNAILDVSKLDAQAVEPHVQSFALRDLFRRLQMSFGGQAEAAGLQLRFKTGGRTVRSDPQLLERTLANLIHNALTYCREGGVVVVARAWKGGTNIEVWDTGIGIAEPELSKIFSEFYQIANPERDRTKGLGIGLAIVARLTKLLGHPLTVRSRVGRGSLFRIWIKGAQYEQLEEFAVGSDTIPAEPVDDKTILFIDDEEAIRTSVCETLRDWGYSVIEVSSIHEAQAAVVQHGRAIDLIISDLRLRDGEDGLIAIDQIREQLRSNVPAILVTGDTAPAQVQRIHESGHIALFKPVPPRELYAVLKNLR